MPSLPVTSGGITTRTLPATTWAVPLQEEAQKVLEGELGGKGELSFSLLQMNSREARLESFLFRAKFLSRPWVRAASLQTFVLLAQKGHSRPSESKARRYAAFYFISERRPSMF